MEKKLTRFLLLMLLVGWIASPVFSDVNYRRYSGVQSNGEWLLDNPNFEGGTLQDEGTINNFDLSLGGTFGLGDNFAFDFWGGIIIETAGEYTFFLISDDGSELYIDGQMVVDNGGDHGTENELSGTVNLSAGPHEIRVKFYEQGGGEALEARWQGPGVAKALIPDNVLVAEIENRLPETSIKFHPSININETSTMTLDATITDDDPDGTGILNIEWSCDDASVSFDATDVEDPTLTFTNAGVFDIMLSVSDDLWTVNDVTTVRVRSTNAPYAWWELKEGTGTSIADSSGNGNLGILDGAKEPNWVSENWLQDQYNNHAALEFYGQLNTDSSLGFVRVTPSATQSPSIDQINDEISICMWFKRNEFNTNWQPLISKGDSDGWRIHRFDMNPYLAFSNEGWGNLEGTIAIDDPYWHHVVIRYSGSVLAMYIDGKLDIKRDQTGTLTTNDFDILIGSIVDSPGGDLEPFRSWNGYIDDVRLYDYAIPVEGSAGTDSVKGLYGMGNPNAAPEALAGDDILITEAPYEVALDGAAEDDGYPANTTTYLWSVESGPGTATFADATDPTTMVEFDTPGVYALKLTVNDTMFDGSDIVKVKIRLNETDNLVAHWDLNNNLVDTVAGLTGTFTGDVLPTFSENGVLDQAVEFYGEGYQDQLSYITVDDSAALDSISEKLAISAWFKVNEFNTTWQPVLCKGDFGQGWRIFRRDGLPYLGFGMQDQNGNIDILGDSYIADGQWHHVVAVFDGVMGYLYIDGKLDATNQAAEPTPLNMNTVPLFIGAANNVNYGNYPPTLDIFRSWNGLIDDVRIYNEELVGPEIDALFYSTCVARALDGTLLPGDVNADCSVDFEDFLAIVDSWLSCNNPTDNNCN